MIESIKKQNKTALRSYFVTPFCKDRKLMRLVIYYHISVLVLW